MDSEIRNKAVETTVIPYIAFESVQARNERHIKRLWIALLVLIAALFATNAMWVWYMFGTDFETYEYEQGDSGINIIGDENKEVTYYGSESEDPENQETNGSAGQN